MEDMVSEALTRIGRKMAIGEERILAGMPHANGAITGRLPNSSGAQRQRTSGVVASWASRSRCEAFAVELQPFGNVEEEEMKAMLDRMVIRWTD
jgi:hypothetical protein